MHPSPCPEDLPGVQGDDGVITGQNTGPTYLVTRSDTSWTESANLPLAKPVRLHSHFGSSRRRLAARFCPTTDFAGEWPDLPVSFRKEG